MNPQEFETLLNELNACQDAKEWCKGKSLAEAWQQSNRSDWMLWLVNSIKTDASDKELRLIAVKCARQVQHLMKDQRSIDALDVAEKFANGEATQEELAAASAAAGGAAGGAAWDAAWDAAGDAARDAARAAARAAAGAAARAAAGAAARGAAWDAAWDAASAAARDAQSNIIREFLPTINILK